MGEDVNWFPRVGFWGKWVGFRGEENQKKEKMTCHGKIKRDIFD